MDEVITVSIYWSGPKMEDGCAPSSHDFWMAPGGFDLESSTAFIEPGTPLISLIVLELELFVAPEERSTSLRAGITGIRSAVRKGESKGHKINIQEWADFAVSIAVSTSR